jgi:hypothetical protein
LKNFRGFSKKKCGISSLQQLDKKTNMIDKMVLSREDTMNAITEARTALQAVVESQSSEIKVRRMRLKQVEIMVSV